MDTDTNDQLLPPPPPPSARKPFLSRTGRRVTIAATAFGLMTGAFAGGFMITHAATATPSPSSSATTTPPAGSGTFTPNENATHEAGESAAREAQENAGQVPTVP